MAEQVKSATDAVDDSGCGSAISEAGGGIRVRGSVCKNDSKEVRPDWNAMADVDGAPMAASAAVCVGM